MPDVLAHALKARLRARAKPKSPPGLASARARFDALKHPRGHGGRFADVPGRGNDAPRKARAESMRRRLQRAIGHAERREEALKRRGITGARYEAALDRTIALKRAAQYGSRYGAESVRLRAALARRAKTSAASPPPTRPDPPKPVVERARAARLEGRAGSLAGGPATEGGRSRRAQRAVGKLLKLRRERTIRREGHDPAATADHPPGYLGELKTDLIHFDPQRFQYKLVQTNSKTGAVGSLAGVKHWDPEVAGVISVWKDPADGKVYVVNGHNRLDKAKELGVESIGVRYLNAKDHVMARAKGAIANIAEGRGTSTDAAKFFRDLSSSTGQPIGRDDLVKRGIPLTEGKTTEALALAGLNEPLFRRVIDGSLPTSKAAIIGGGGLSHDQQKSVADAFDKAKGGMTENELREAVDDAYHAGSRQKDDGPDLFGDKADESIAPHRWNLIANAKERLREEKNLFGVVSKKKKADKLAAAGNTIDTEGAAKIRDEAAEALTVFDGLKRTSLFNGVLNDYASQIAAAKNERERKRLRNEAYDEIRKRVKNAYDLR